MIGVVVVAHFKLAREMVAATELIVGRQEQFTYVDIFPDEDVEQIKGRVVSALKSMNSGEGVIILTDMFGGTPSNISLSFLEEKKIEVITGVNLPMLLKLATYKNEMSLEELAFFITDYGQRNINLASEVLKKRVEKKKS